MTATDNSTTDHPANKHRAFNTWKASLARHPMRAAVLRTATVETNKPYSHVLILASVILLYA
jgi:hypothetical protein